MTQSEARGSISGDLSVDFVAPAHDLKLTCEYPALQLDGEQVVTSGGRVLCVTTLGEDIRQAQRLCYPAADNISWDGMTLRRDIGWRAIARG